MTFETALGIGTAILLAILFICALIYRPCGLKRYLQRRKDKLDLERGPSPTPSIVIQSRLAPMNQTKEYEGSMPRLRNNTFLARGMSCLKNRLDLVYTWGYVRSLSIHIPRNLECPSHNASHISLRRITPRPFVTPRPGAVEGSPAPALEADVVRIAAPVEEENHGFSSTPVTGRRNASMDIANVWRSPLLGLPSTPMTAQPYSPAPSTLSGATAVGGDTFEGSFVGQESSNSVPPSPRISPLTSNFSFSTAPDSPREGIHLGPVAPSEGSPRSSVINKRLDSKRLAAPSRRNDIMRIATLPKQPPLDMGRWTEMYSHA